jgi:hypothetical protein
MRMRITNLLRAVLREIEAFFEVQLPMDALLGLRTR